MSYYPRSGGHNGVEDFDDFDPTPYGGGYDINLTYGRPLSASHDTCYLPASSSSSQGGHGHGHATAGEDDDRFNNSHHSSIHVVGSPAAFSGVVGGYKEDSGCRRKNEPEEHQRPTRYDHKKHDDNDNHEKPTRYGRNKHDDDDEDGGHGKPTHYGRKKPDDDDDQSKATPYGHKKHADKDDSSDEDEKKQRRRKDHQHRSYDDE